MLPRYVHFSYPNLLSTFATPPICPYLGNVAKLIRRRRISLKRDNHPKNPSVKSMVAERAEAKSACEEASGQGAQSHANVGLRWVLELLLGSLNRIALGAGKMPFPHGRAGISGIRVCSNRC